MPAKTEFDDFSTIYDKFNDFISLKTHKHVKTKALRLLDVRGGDKVLDLCTGTGDVAIILKKLAPNALVTGVDISTNMLEIAKKRTSQIEFIKADVCELPFNDETFDVAVTAFGLRNVTEREKAINEISRILKNGGELLHIDFSQENKLAYFIFKMLVILGAKLFGARKIPYKYFLNSIDSTPQKSELLQEFEQVGLTHKTTFSQMFGVVQTNLFIKNSK